MPGGQKFRIMNNSDRGQQEWFVPQTIRGGQLVFGWDRLENFLVTRNRPVGNKDASTKCHKMQ